ncbi:MAG: hypothetical protein GEV05_27835 [Betaproteobacteria bacterium]|nr:hypothetical protein [Betaproteobacteria bacterium]
MNGRDTSTLHARQAELERRGLHAETAAFDVTDHDACAASIGVALCWTKSLNEIHAKEGNLSIPLYVAAQASEARQDQAEYQAGALPDALRAWQESSKTLRRSLEALFAGSDLQSQSPARTPNPSVAEVPVMDRKNSVHWPLFWRAALFLSEK